MPEKDKNTLFKGIIFRKYKDEINWVKMINYLFKKRKIFEEDVAILTELFNEKNNDWLKKSWQHTDVVNNIHLLSLNYKIRRE